MSDLDISPKDSYGLLSNLKLPYNVYGSHFRLNEHLREINCRYKRIQTKYEDVTTVTVKQQIAHWRECMISAASGEDSGWTACFAGPGSIAYPEACAAELAAHYMRSSRPVAWINLTARLGCERNLVDEIAPYVQASQLHALFVSGLRWEGDPQRFDKVFDLLRMSDPKTDRIIVGTGEDPIAITRACDISVMRVLNVVESRFVNLAAENMGA